MLELRKGETKVNISSEKPSLLSAETGLQIVKTNQACLVQTPHVPNVIWRLLGFRFCLCTCFN